MDIPNIDVTLSTMLTAQLGAVVELVRKADNSEELADRARALASIAQTIEALNRAGVTSIDRQFMDEFLSRLRLEDLIS